MFCDGIVDSEAPGGRLVRYYSGKGRVGADTFRQTAAVLVFIVMVKIVIANQLQMSVITLSLPLTNLACCSCFQDRYCRTMTLQEGRAHSTPATDWGLVTRRFSRTCLSKSDVFAPLQYESSLSFKVVGWSRPSEHEYWLPTLRCRKKREMFKC
jgi:hypothetical protein